MRKIFMRLGIAAGALLLSGNFAYPATFCENWAANAVKYSQSMRALAQSVPGGTCTGHNLLDPFWSTNSKRQRQWCTSVSRDTANTRTGEMNDAITRCGYCAGYANILTTAAAENQKFGCGFKDDGDTRWSGTAVSHFQGCMTVQDCDDDCRILGVAACYKACLNFDGLKAKIMDPIVSQVTTAIAQCKVEKGINTSSSALTVPKAIPPLRDSVGRVKHQGNASIKSNNDLVAPARPSSRRPTARETAVTEKSDHAPPAGRARSRPDPCKSVTATKPCSVGSNTSAMDRLGGDSPTPASARPSGRDGNGRTSAGGGSAVAKPTASNPTTDLGKCASCGKLSPATR